MTLTQYWKPHWSITRRQKPNIFQILLQDVKNVFWKKWTTLQKLKGVLLLVWHWSFKFKFSLSSSITGPCHQSSGPHINGHFYIFQFSWAKNDRLVDKSLNFLNIRHLNKHALFSCVLVTWVHSRAIILCSLINYPQNTQVSKLGQHFQSVTHHSNPSYLFNTAMMKPQCIFIKSRTHILLAFYSLHIRVWLEIKKNTKYVLGYILIKELSFFLRFGHVYLLGACVLIFSLTAAKLKHKLNTKIFKQP